MRHQCEHLLNPNPNAQGIVVLGGLPGSGKSTLARDFIDAGYEWINPDTYRGILSRERKGHAEWTQAQLESDQSVSHGAWEMAYAKAREALEKGRSIVFDAVLHTPKARRRLLNQLIRFKIPRYAVYLDVTLETAKERNDRRFDNGGRRVPDYVIEEKWRAQVLPSREEGFNDVVIISDDLTKSKFNDERFRNELIQGLINDSRKTIQGLYDSGQLDAVFPSLRACWGIDQENRHHTLPLHEHMITAAERILPRTPEAVVSALLHDVGKTLTKEFFVRIVRDNDLGLRVGERHTLVSKGPIGTTIRVKSYGNGGYRESLVLVPNDVIEIDPDAHFYNHDKIGAVLARRDLLALGFDEDFANRVYGYVLHHMELPYSPVDDDRMRKLISRVGRDRIGLLLELRRADKLAGADDLNNVEDLHAVFTRQVESILGGLS